MMSFERFVDIGFSLTLFANALLFIPQIISLIKKKNAEGVSLFMFFGFNVMQIFTVLHAYVVQDFTLMMGFGLSFVLCGIITCLIIFYRRKKIDVTCIESPKLEQCNTISQAK